jgi:hypothetical protein
LFAETKYGREKIMSKENRKDLQKSADERLGDDELEQVAGGHIEIELIEDEPINLAGENTVKRG